MGQTPKSWELIVDLVAIDLAKEAFQRFALWVSSSKQYNTLETSKS